MERRRRQLTDLPYLDIRRQMLPRLPPSTSVDALTMCMIVPAQDHLHASFSLLHSMGTFSCYLHLTPTPSSGHPSKLTTLSSLLSHRWVWGYHAPQHRLIHHKPRSPLHIERTPKPGLSWWSAATHDFTTLLPVQVLIHKWINQDPGISGKHLDESQSQDLNPVLLGSSFSPIHILLPGGYAVSRTSSKTTQ